MRAGSVARYRRVGFWSATGVETTSTTHSFNMPRRASMSPGPWTLRWQTSPKGKKSRFEILDANGRRVATVRKELDARALVRMLEVRDVMQPLRSHAASLHLQLQSALGFNYERDKIIGEAETLLRLMGWSFY